MSNYKESLRKHKIDLLFLIVIIIYHLFIREYSGDSLGSYAHFLDEHDILWSLQWRYMNWTSRILIDLPIILIAHNYHIVIWKIFDVAMFYLLYHSANELTDNRHPYLIASLILIYPLAPISSAGWIATTINYLWPAATGAFALILTKRICQKNNVCLPLIILSIICETFSSNFESLALFFLIILSYTFIYALFILQLKIDSLIILILQLIICMLNLISAYICPGNWKRKNAEIIRMHDFKTLTPIDKLSLGTTSTISYLVSFSILFIIFSVTMIIAISYMYKNSNTTGKSVLISLNLLPIILYMTKTLFPTISQSFFASINQLLGYTSRVNAANYWHPASYFSFILAAIIITTILISLIITSTLIEQGILYAVIFIAALSTRIILGLSPLIFASGDRTFFFFEIATIYLTVQLYDNRISTYLRTNKNMHFIIKTALNTIIVISFIANLTHICSM